MTQTILLSTLGAGAWPHAGARQAGGHAVAGLRHGPGLNVQVLRWGSRG